MDKKILVTRAVIGSHLGILLIQRSQTDVWQPNIWEFPGGKTDVGNAQVDLLNELKREIKEETGLTNILFGSGINIKFINITIESGKLKKYQNCEIVTKYIYGEANRRQLEVILSLEHQAYQWIKTLREIENLQLKPNTMEVLQRIL